MQVQLVAIGFPDEVTGDRPDPRRVSPADEDSMQQHRRQRSISGKTLDV
jgi:hypothetical protein